MATQEAVMTTVDIANRLYELCKEGHYQQAQEELLADDALSIEPVHANEKGVPSVTGKDATFKGMGKMVMEEVAVYEVRDGKVVKEQFFY